MAAGIELAPLLTKIKVDIASFKSDMDKAGTIGKSEAEKISKQMTSITKVGDTLTKTGELLTKSVTVPIVGIGIASGKMAVDFESDFAKVSTLLRDTTDFGEYKSDVIKGSNEMKTAVGDYSDAVYQSISAGVDQANAVEFTNGAIKLAKGGFTDASKAVDILTTAINAYGLETSDATKVSDMLVTTQNLGKTTVDELSASMGKVIPTANSFHVGLSDVTTSIADLTKNGIATAESVTYLNGMFNELGSSGTVANTTIKEMSGKTFSEFMDSGGSLTDALGMLVQKADETGISLADMFGSTEAAKAALTIMKDGGVEYNQILGQMESSAGATQKAFEKIDATPAEKMSGALNKLKNAGIELGSSLVPIITKVADVVDDAADKFANMSEEQQESILKWAAMAAAAGPALSVAGKTVTTYTKIAPVLKGVSAASKEVGAGAAIASSGIGSLASVCVPLVAGAAVVGTGLYAIHENSELMGRSCTDASEDMSGMEKVMAKLSGTEVKSREELEQLGLVQKELGDNLSKDFKKAVEESTEKAKEFNLSLQEINMDDVITPEESDAFTESVNTMCNEVIATINSKKDEAQEGMKALMVADDGVVDESEQHILDILSQSSVNQINEVQTLQSDILAIKQKAVDEGRALNEQEIADIEEKNARIRAIELEAVGGTEEEIVYAKNEFAARVKTMDADAASELLQQKATDRDEQITQITASYDTEIELLKSKYAEMSDEEKAANKEAIDERIGQWEDEKNKRIQQQNDLYDEYLQITMNGNENLKNAINKYNGEILANEDFKAQERMEQYRNCYAGLESITQSGTYNMYNQLNDSWDNVTVSVDSATGEITAAWSDTVGISAGYTNQMANDAQSASASFTGASTTIYAAADLQMDAMGNIVTKNGDTVGSMKNVKAGADGVRQGIVQINGTPYNIKVNKKGTIEALNEISSAADNAAKERTIVMRAEYYSSGAERLETNGSRKFNGIDNVPYDGYRAILHKNERVLTAEENKQYSAVPEVNYEVIKSIIRNEMSGFIMKVNGRELGRIVRDEI